MINEYPLVSIAIITYNQIEYLKECIESCLSQDYPRIEIIVADDGSTDGTHEMLKEYDNKNPGKFVLKLSEKNQGITRNSNVAHFACTGKYIAWMGGDDLMLPEKISKQVEYMESNPECTICYHSRDVFDSETNRTISISNSKDKDKINGTVRESIRYGTFNGACSTMVRREKTPINGFDNSVPVASDWLFWVETLANGGTINYIDGILSRYRRHDGNVTQPKNFIAQNELDHLVSCQIMIAKYPEYFNDVMYAYSVKLRSIKKKANYLSVLWRSFCLFPSYQALGGMLIYIITFGKVKY